MRISVLLMFLAGLAPASGCSQKQVYQGIYEGNMVRSQLQETPAERAGKPAPVDYQQYERLRRERTSSETTVSGDK